jgi:hypothetical protein
MNFLSHYYFDSHNPNSYFVLGTILPDLIKNADKKWLIHPQKNEEKFTSLAHLSLFNGYQKHLAVDRIFHNSDFFKYYQNHFKKILKQAVGTSKVKPFFVGHIALELLLDHILITRKLVDVDLFYQQLNGIDHQIVNDFLSLNGITDTEKFHQFFIRFKTEQYLYHYLELEKISYAIKRICMRIWLDPLTLEQENALTDSLMQCKNELAKEFISIFDLVESQLN